ncbi:MAG: hypothetical protein Tsb0020_15630 [Haliangiales bacterium]
MSSSHPFNPGEHKYALILPLGGMIILGIVTTTLGFLFWPDPKPHHDVSTEGFFSDAGAARVPAPPPPPPGSLPGAPTAAEDASDADRDGADAGASGQGSPGAIPD